MTSDKRLTVPLFYNDFLLLLEDIALHPGFVMLCGDFNFNVDDASNQNAVIFNDIISSANFSQLVAGPTHEAGHTLDLILTRALDNFVDEVKTSNPLPSDHAVVECWLNLSKPEQHKVKVKFRKFRDMDIDAFRSDIRSSTLCVTPSSDLNVLIDQYENVLADLMDVHAPEMIREVRARPHAPWYNNSLRLAKQDLRRWERLWNSSKLEVYRQIFRKQRILYKNMLEQAKKEYYRLSFEGCSARQLFQKVCRLSSPSSSKTLPSNEGMNRRQLADHFSQFFSDKIENITSSFASAPVSTHKPGTDVTPGEHPCMIEFDCVTVEAVKKLIIDSPSTSCEMDPLPTWLVKKCVDELSPVIARIINLSFRNGHFPDSLKQANVNPLLKKPGLDPEVLKNYRPIAKLKFIDGRFSGLVVLADDIALITSSSTELQQMLEVAFNYAQQWHYRFNPSKCAVVVTNKTKKPTRSSWEVGGSIIEEKDNHPHLGVIKSGTRFDPTDNIIGM
ncbi:uncharacterized protein LOC135156767 [Lytechinus pictus]|uniref:uncharacterized protein LOC135156767 n=1 Tax=Lytechinus pictus TaxID=7653 RepID=UPI0030B9E313